MQPLAYRNLSLVRALKAAGSVDSIPFALISLRCTGQHSPGLSGTRHRRLDAARRAIMLWSASIMLWSALSQAYICSTVLPSEDHDDGSGPVIVFVDRYLRRRGVSNHLLAHQLYDPGSAQMRQPAGSHDPAGIDRVQFNAGIDPSTAHTFP